MPLHAVFKRIPSSAFSWYVLKVDFLRSKDPFQMFKSKFELKMRALGVYSSAISKDKSYFQAFQSFH